MRFIIIFILFLCVIVSSFSQDRYRIVFKDKEGTTFDPYAYFDSKAIERRQRLNISLNDTTDFPVCSDYIDIICSKGARLTSVSRWFNCAYVDLDGKNVDAIENLPFVCTVERVNSNSILSSSKGKKDLAIDMDMLDRQTLTLGRSDFEKNGIDGTGMRIAIFDAGFPGVDKHPAFKHIRDANHIIMTYDFTRNDEFVYSYNHHGTMVLSCIAGMYEGMKIGLATGAEFLLARTEVKSEPFSEEENWLRAVEWADKNGADIINSSLGYTYHRYFQEDMDGKESLVSRAANLAARKGILVVNANGNDGTSFWKIVGTPADADSVLSVGGIDPDTDIHISFSSYGPTSDKRMKPNVSAFGHVIAADKKGYNPAQGTSFASPLVAGFAACAWQTDKSLSNMQLFHEIEKSASLYPYFDYAHGFGVPQASYFTEKNHVKTSESFSVEINNNSLILTFNDQLQDKERYVFYHFQDKSGFLKYYCIVDLHNESEYTIDLNRISSGEIVRIHYKGKTYEYKNE